MAKHKSAPRAWTWQRKTLLWLADHGETLTDFAKRVGVPQPTMHGWLKSGVKAPVESVLEIARAIGVGIDALVDQRVTYEGMRAR